jgi:hypothetical protein
VGRKQLIQLSVAGALLSHLAVGYGLNNGLVTLSSIAITTFVMYVLHIQLLCTTHVISKVICFRIRSHSVCHHPRGGTTPCQLFHHEAHRSFTDPIQAVSAISSVGLSLNCKHFCAFEFPSPTSIFKGRAILSLVWSFFRCAIFLQTVIS